MISVKCYNECTKIRSIYPTFYWQGVIERIFSTQKITITPLSISAHIADVSDTAEKAKKKYRYVSSEMSPIFPLLNRPKRAPLTLVSRDRFKTLRQLCSHGYNYFRSFQLADIVYPQNRNHREDPATHAEAIDVGVVALSEQAGTYNDFNGNTIFHFMIHS